MHGIDSVTTATAASEEDLDYHVASDEESTSTSTVIVQELLDAVDVATQTFVAWPGRLLSRDWYLRAGYFPRGG